MDKVVIGIDQSYTRTGITVLVDREVFEVYSIDFKGCKNNTEKRITLRGKIIDIINQAVSEIKSENIIIICERIRLRSQGFLSENYIKSTGALIASIIDICYGYNLPVYSVDTRAWKSAIIGSSKPLNNPYGINPEKYRTILYMRDKGLLSWIAEEYSGRGEKGVIWANRTVRGHKEKVRIKVNDDLADSYCIALYGFLPKSKQKLKEERF
mgnify:CR=1 FL=1